MRVLITGSNGLLGQRLLHALSGDIYDLYGLDLASDSFLPEIHHHYLAQDLTNRQETIDLIRRIQPQAVIHTAAMTAVDLCETQREVCWRVNVTATENVVQGCFKAGARVIYISTDYVFNGEKGPYKEEDTPNPISYYAKSKLAGENVVRGVGNDWTVIRTIVLYGCGKNIKSSFVTWLLGELRAGKPVHIVNDQWGNTTIADDLAYGVDRLLLLEKHGLLHMGGSEFMTRYEFALRIARYFGLDESLVHPITTAELNQPARRPLRSGLVTDKAEGELYIRFRNIEQSLQLYKEIEQTANQA
jgi:dTDP-4-dehydrorhamnose reductase